LSEIRKQESSPCSAKEGGAYVTATGKPRKLDESAGVLVLEDRARIPIRCRVSLEGDFLYGPSGGPSPSRGTRGWGMDNPGSAGTGSR
jgi:hypothetical protein